MAVSIPALLGLVGLAIDGARLMTLDAELAGVADATALAAASRLNRSDGAMREAREAANAVFARAPLADRRDGTRLSFRFAASLSDLRLNPNYSMSEGEAAQAAFVEVTTAEHSLATSFLQLVGARASPIRRRAIAESQYYACDVTPAVMCHPDPDEFAAKAKPGRQYLLRMDGNRTRGSVLPLDRSDAANGRQTLVNLASNAPQFCFSDGVQLRTNISPGAYDEALNIRFDRYFTQSGPVAPDLAVFPPAPNVIQGRRLESCASPPSGGDIYPPYRLPRDTAFSGLALTGFWDAGSGDWKSAPPFGGRGPHSGLRSTSTLPGTTAINRRLCRIGCAAREPATRSICGNSGSRRRRMARRSIRERRPRDGHHADRRTPIGTAGGPLRACGPDLLRGTGPTGRPAPTSDLPIRRGLQRVSGGRHGREPVASCGKILPDRAVRPWRHAGRVRRDGAADGRPRQAPPCGSTRRHDVGRRGRNERGRGRTRGLVEYRRAGSLSDQRNLPLVPFGKKPVGRPSAFR
jgi:hypothetical protein